MQDNRALTPIVLYPTSEFEDVLWERPQYITLQNKLYYAVSRLRAALKAFSHREPNRNHGWWLEGIRYELVC